MTLMKQLVIFCLLLTMGHAADSSVKENLHSATAGSSTTTTKPGETTSGSTTTTTKPGETTSGSTTTTTKPGETTSGSTTTTTKPGETTSGSTTTTTKPGETTSGSTTTTTKPGETTSGSTTTTTKPGETTSGSTTTTTKPGETTSGSTTTATKPGETTSGSTTTTTKPGETTSGSTTTTTKPGETTSGSTTTTTKPGETTAGSTTTTTKPGETTSGSTTTTTKPGETTSGSTTTTTKPGETTAGSTTTTTKPGETTAGSTTTTTKPGETTAGTTKATTEPDSPTSMATTTAGPCALNPCPPSSTCEERLGSFTCLCRPGLFYNEEQKTCSLAKTFPTEIEIEKTYVEEMANKNSPQFKKTSEEIIKALNDLFRKQPGYIESTVLSLSPGSVIADVENFFNVTSDVSNSLVQETLVNATQEDTGLFAGASVTLKTLCSKAYCDDTTTDCKSTDGFASCFCLEGFVQSPATDQACIPCPNGQKPLNLKDCELCPFGTSGFNCTDSYLLILVIVSSVLGSLLLAALVAVIVVSSRRSQKGTSSDDGDVLSDTEFCRPAGIPRIPRVSHNSEWQPANLEVTDSGSTRALVTRERPASIAMESYNSYNDGSSYSYGYGNRSRGISNGSRGTRNPYYSEDDRIRRY